MLTDTKLSHLKPKVVVYRVADTNGLCIEVRPSGSKLWRYGYRHAGKASMAALGEYPLMTLAEARAERDCLRALVKGGAGGPPSGLSVAESSTSGWSELLGGGHCQRRAVSCVT